MSPVNRKATAVADRRRRGRAASGVESRRPMRIELELEDDAARHEVRMDGVTFYRAWPGLRFVRTLKAGNYSYCVAVRAGRMKFNIDFPTAQSMVLEPGDMLSLSGLAPHVFRSLDALDETQTSEFAPVALEVDGEPEGVDLIIGCVPSERLAFGSLSLGHILVRAQARPDLARRLWRALDMVEDEYRDATWGDRSHVIRRSAEIMVVNFTRCAFMDRQRPDSEHQQPVANQRLLQAINAFFQSPDHPWNLQELARAAGMSRTRFAEEFKIATGETPFRIISRLRLTTVAHRMAYEALSVEAAAEEAGYSSAAAFVRAFHRAFGETPARWRRQRRAPSAQELLKPPLRSADAAIAERPRADA